MTDDGALRDIVTASEPRAPSTAWPADDMCSYLLIIKKTNRKSCACGQKSKFHSAHAHLLHLEVLHAKFHDRETSNLED